MSKTSIRLWAHSGPATSPKAPRTPQADMSGIRIRQAIRQLHTGPALQSSGSILNLSGLSTSREARFLSKERGIPRTEFSPHLELIRTSEVDPFNRNRKSKDDRKAIKHRYDTSNRGSGSPSASDIAVSDGLTTLAQESATLRLENHSLQKALQDLRTQQPAEKREQLLTIAVLTVVFWVGFMLPNWVGYDPPEQQVKAILRRAWQDTKTLTAEESASASTDLVSPAPEIVERTPEVREADLPKTTQDNRLSSPIATGHSSSAASSWSTLFWASEK